MHKKQLAIYMISDSSGETVESFSKAVISQFVDVAEIEEYSWPLVRSTKQIDEIFSSIESKSGVVLYTVVDHELADYIQYHCSLLNLKYVGLMNQSIEAVADFLSIDPPMTGMPGKYKNLDDSYYKKIDIVNYTLQHDDGQISEHYNEADIILLGVSRTSKSPTALYLAHRGYKTGNIPIIKSVDLDLSAFSKPLIVGLMIDHEVLMQIRSIRLCRLNSEAVLSESEDCYMNREDVLEELIYARKFFVKNNIPIVDVTKKAIEETAAEVINMYFERHGEHKVKS